MIGCPLVVTDRDEWRSQVRRPGGPKRLCRGAKLFDRRIHRHRPPGWYGPPFQASKQEVAREGSALRRLQHFPTKTQATATVAAWIEDYNTIRRHSATGHDVAGPTCLGSKLIRMAWPGQDAVPMTSREMAGGRAGWLYGIEDDACLAYEDFV